MSDPIWSRQFARRVAELLGYRVPAMAPELGYVDFDTEAEKVVEAIAEAFRYLPPGHIQGVLDYAEFLRSHKIAGFGVECLQTWVPEKLRQVQELTLFLKQRHGTALPADEKDYWTEEDERDFALQTWQRLEAEDPWPEEDSYLQEGQGDPETR
jgi:hypothetical protein